MYVQILSDGVILVAFVTGVCTTSDQGKETHVGDVLCAM